MKKSLELAGVIVLISLITSAARCTNGSSTAAIGDQAMEWTGKIVDFGPRPSGSDGSKIVREWILQQTKVLSFEAQEHAFTSTTPAGPVNMVNVSYVIPGKNHDRRVVLVAHYDSKFFTGFSFVGANDAASSVALLMALSAPIKKMNLAFDVEVVFVDGEEAIVSWSDTDSLYGSKRYVAGLENTASIKAAIIVDMIGDKDLTFIRSSHSDLHLVSAMEKTLKNIGKSKLLDTQVSFVEDDHMPFVNVGIPVLHVMDFTYGGTQSPGTIWHTAQDTLDKLSADSLSTTAQVILGVLGSL